MKWFYVIALASVALLTLSPLLLLEARSDDEYEGLVVEYDSYGSAVKSIDPATCGDVTSSSIQGNFYEALYCYHYLKRPPTVIPQLAAEMPEISDDGLTYTIKLKPGVVYSRNPCFGVGPDGKPKTREVRAQDFVLAMKRCRDYHVNTGLAWAFLSNRIVGLDEFRARTRGIPDDAKEAFAKLDAWRAKAAFGSVPEDVAKAMKQARKWADEIHPVEEVSAAFKGASAWMEKPTAEMPAAVRRAFETIDAWRRTIPGYKIGDFSRYDLPVAGLRALDGRTLRIKLRERFPQFIYVLAMHVYAPIPREAVDYWLGTEDDGRGGRRLIPVAKRSTEFKEAHQVVGTGPYLLKTFSGKKRIVMVRNPDFREEFYPAEGERGDTEAGLLADAGKRVPFIDVIHLDFVAESYAGWMRFLTKQSDASGIPKETFDFVVNPGKKLTDTWRKRHIYLEYNPPVVYWIVFNMEDPVLGASKSLRQALCLAYDVENHIKVLHNGRGKRSVNIIPSTFKGHKAAGPGPYYHLDVQAAKRKLAEAKKQLAAAGKLVGGEIPTLRLDLARGTAVTRMAEFVEQQFAKLGLRIKATYNDWPTLQRKVHNKEVQMYTMGWHADYPDAENFLQLYYSPNIKKATNNSNYSNKEFDELYEKARVLSDTPERMRLYVKMIRMISEDCPVLLLSEPTSFVLYYDWVKNVKRHPIGYGFTKYMRIDTELRRKLGGR